MQNEQQLSADAEASEAVMNDAFDLVVIGAGPAGEKGAAQAAYYNKKVALIEHAPKPGGIAVSSAGIPTKTLRETALYVSGFRNREVYGLSLDLDPHVTLERLMTRKAEVVTVMTKAVERNLVQHGIEVIQGKARLGRNRTVHVTRDTSEERTLRASVVLLATGSHPVLPPRIPFDDPDVYDPVRILQLDRLPSTLLVVGGGAVGCEYASIFTALGVKVTLVDPHPQLLRCLDVEIAHLQAEVFNSLGMRLSLGIPLTNVRRVAGRLQVHLANGQILSPEKVLFATGRAGNTAGLGLEEVGVALNTHGDIMVNDRFETTVPGVYAAGDVIGPPRLASVSMEQARVAICHAFGSTFKERVDPQVPHCVFSIPEVAMVGMTEEQAQTAGIEYEVGRGQFAANSKARISGLYDGLIKLVFRRADRTLLGVHILGETASELIHQGQLVLHEGGTIDRFIHMTFAAPSRSEAYKYAAYDGLGRLDRWREVRRTCAAHV
jgi:NAD(P) transhydrogenase